MPGSKPNWMTFTVCMHGGKFQWLDETPCLDRSVLARLKNMVFVQCMLHGFSQNFWAVWSTSALLLADFRLSSVPLAVLAQWHILFVCPLYCASLTSLVHAHSKLKRSVLSNSRW